jgi:beta-lactamase regulating signal transducer with metallopeptidase domain
MLGSTQLDSYLIFLFNWLIVLVGLTLLGTIVTSASRRWSIASRHCLALALLATFLLAPIALVIASRSGIAYLVWELRPQTAEVGNVPRETSESWQPNIDEQPRAQPVIAQSDKESDGEPLEANSIHATIESDSPTAIGAVSQPVSIRWVSVVRLALILTGTVWLIGSLVCFFRLGRNLQSLHLLLKRLNSVQDQELLLLVQQAQQRIGLRGHVKIFQSSSNSVPISFGILSSIIVVPKFFASQVSQEQQRAVLLHEMAHLDRRDSYVGLLQEVCHALYWWHPWILRRSKELDQLRELLCDHRVVEIEGDGRTLAEALLQIAQCAIEPRLRLPCLSSIGDQVEDLAQRLRVLCNETQLNLRPLSSVKRLGIQLVASLCVLGTAIPMVADDEKHDAKKAKVQQVPSRSDDEWIEILVVAKSHNPVAFQHGPEIVALDRKRSLSIVQRAWPQIQIAEVKNGILKAFQFSENPNILEVLHLGMTDADPAVQDYARSYICYCALQKFERNSPDYAAWYVAHRGQSLKDVLLDGYRDIAQMCDQQPATVAIQKLQERERTIDDKWKSLRSTVRSTALKESGIGAFPIKWIRSATLDQDQMAYACKLLRQIPGRPLESVDTLKSWLDDKEPLMLRASAAIGLAELDRDAAIDAMLRMIEEITRDEEGDKAGESRMRDELCWKLSELGEPRTIAELIAIMDCDNSSETIRTIDGALTSFRLQQDWVREELRPMRDGPWWRRWWEKNRERMPEPLRQVAIRDIPKTKFGKAYVPFPADMDTHEGLKAYLEQELKKDSPSYVGLGHLFSMQQDLRGIPILIGAIDSDNSYETIYGLGYYGLGFFKGENLTGVEYSPYHDGAWWRRWWEANKHRFPPEVQATPIPDYPKSAHGKSYRPFPANMDTFEGRVEYLRRELSIADSRLATAAEGLESYPDPRMIAMLIGVWVACDEAQLREECNAFVRPLYNTITKEKQFDMQAIVDAQWTAKWWRDWYQQNRSKIKGLEDFDLPDFRGELSKRAGK